MSDQGAAAVRAAALQRAAAVCDPRPILVELLDRALRGGVAAFGGLLGGRPGVELVKVDAESTLWKIEPRGGQGQPSLLVKVFNEPDGRRVMEREAAAMRLLTGLRFPVACVLDQWPGNPVFPQSVIVREWIPGRMASDGLRQGGPRSLDIAGGVGRLLSCLHALPVAAAEVAAILPRYQGEGDVVARLSSRLQRCGLSGLFATSIAWVKAALTSLPPVHRGECMVHGDFHPGNIVERETGDLLVLDLTLAGLGDPRLDLAWAAVQISPSVDDPLRLAMLTAYAAGEGVDWSLPTACEAFACLRGLANAAGMEGRCPTMSTGDASVARQLFNSQLVDRWQALTGLAAPYDPTLDGRV